LIKVIFTIYIEIYFELGLFIMRFFWKNKIAPLLKDYSYYCCGGGGKRTKPRGLIKI